MPRKNRTPASLLSNRENQRKSRARHREFINELQQRVLEYERRDAQATLEMQRVARTVAEENEALREMLAMKGVQVGEVEEFVAMRRHQWSMQASTAASSEAPLGLQGQLTTTLKLQNASISPVLPPEDHQHQLLINEQLRGDTKAHTEIPTDVPTTCAYTRQTDTAEGFSGIPPTDPSYYYPPELPQAPTPPSDGMHCLEAASILAQLRGHPDSTLARAALGCAMKSDCVIRNTDLLQLVDDMP